MVLAAFEHRLAERRQRKLALEIGWARRVRAERRAVESGDQRDSGEPKPIE
jgi:hypothetical protein